MNLSKYSQLETTLQEEPFSLKTWSRLIDTVAADQGDGSPTAKASSFRALNLYYERAIKALPFSFKLWSRYCQSRVYQLEFFQSLHRKKSGSDDALRPKVKFAEIHLDEPEHEEATESGISDPATSDVGQNLPFATERLTEIFYEVKEIFDRAVKALPMMPLLWMQYLNFVVLNQHSIASSSSDNIKKMITQAINASFSALPVEQHDAHWEECIRPLLSNASSALTAPMKESLWHKYCLYRNSPEAFLEYQQSLAKSAGSLSLNILLTGIAHARRTEALFPIYCAKSVAFWSSVAEVVDAIFMKDLSGVRFANGSFMELVSWAGSAGEKAAEGFLRQDIGNRPFCRRLLIASGVLFLSVGKIASARNCFDRLARTLSIGVAEIEEALSLQHRAEAQLISLTLDSAALTTTASVPVRSGGGTNKKSEPAVANEQKRTNIERKVSADVVSALLPDDQGAALSSLDQLVLHSEEQLREAPMLINDAKLRDAPWQTSLWVERIGLVINDHCSRDSLDSVHLVSLLSDSLARAAKEFVPILSSNYPFPEHATVLSQTKWLVPVAVGTQLTQLNPTAFDETVQAFLTGLVCPDRASLTPFIGKKEAYHGSSPKLLLSTPDVFKNDVLLLEYVTTSLRPIEARALLESITAQASKEIKKYHSSARGKRGRNEMGPQSGTGSSFGGKKVFTSLFAAISSNHVSFESNGTDCSPHLSLQSRTWELLFAIQVSNQAFSEALKTLKTAVLDLGVLSASSLGRLLRLPGTDRLPQPQLGEILATALRLSTTDIESGKLDPAVGVLVFVEFAAWVSKVLENSSKKEEDAEDATWTHASAATLEWARDSLDSALTKLMTSGSGNVTNTMMSPKQRRACFVARSEIETQVGQSAATINILFAGINGFLDLVLKAKQKGFLLTSDRHYIFCFGLLEELQGFGKETLASAIQLIGAGSSLVLVMNLMTKTQSLLHSLIEMQVKQSRQDRLMTIIEGIFLLLTGVFVPKAIQCSAAVGSLAQSRNFFRMSTHYCVLLLQHLGGVPGAPINSTIIYTDNRKSLLGSAKAQLHEAFQSWKEFEVEQGNPSSLEEVNTLFAKTTAAVHPPKRTRVDN